MELEGNEDEEAEEVEQEDDDSSLEEIWSFDFLGTSKNSSAAAEAEEHEFDLDQRVTDPGFRFDLALLEDTGLAGNVPTGDE